MKPQRLPAAPGEWIDRSRSLAFSFEGRRYEGHPGDTLASALLAAGVTVLGRSFKYHRRRSVLSFANHDVNAVVQAGQRLNMRADVEALSEGLEFHAVNTVGGLAKDRAAFMDRLSAFLPVGFYYKAFHTPRAWFPAWERLVRRFAGLGELRFDTPRIITPKRYDFCDLLVVGAGAAGLSAARAAGRAGARVVVVDENARAGGALAYAGGAESRGRLAGLLADIAALPNVDIRPATLAAAYYADRWLPLLDRERITKMRAGAVLVASGAYEQPAVFRNNDLPGVMLASAAQRLLARHSVAPFRRVLVLAANADGYRAALDFLDRGMEVAALLDLRPGGEPSPLADALIAAGVEVLPGHGVVEALAGSGGTMAGAAISRLTPDGGVDPERAWRVACDGIAMSVGWAGASGLLHQAGSRFVYRDDLHQFAPSELPPGIFAAGRVNGAHGIEARLADGERAGLEAARHLGLSVGEGPAVPAEACPPSHPYPVFAHPRGKNFVDFDEDLQLKDFENAAQEGFDNIELMKRYTTVGMGPSQGKHSNMNSIRILARLRGLPPGAVGGTTQRPFIHPVPMSHLAGRGFSPRRLTPLHPRHQALGAEFMEAGAWLRPACYAAAGQDRGAAIAAEVRAVRTGLGLIDVGTLGKLEVHGPDAAAFLERVYTGRYANMKPGTTRYALMLDDAGVVIDDGVVARLSEDRYYFTTTTTGSVTVYRELTRLNTLWGLRVAIVNATGAFAAVNLAGPRAREALAPLAEMDLSDPAFPFLACREGRVAGVAARLMRVGFVGELGYEIHVPAEYALHLWDRLMEAGAAFGIRPFGVEAQRVLRLEKGHLIVGQDTDGLTTPLEANLGFALKMDKPYFTGQRSLRIVAKKPLKQVLAGFALPAGQAPLPKECHLVIRDGAIAGRVTSICDSETLGHPVGLAFLPPDLAAPGSRFQIRADGGAMVEATVVPTPFLDPQGARQKA